MKTKALVLLSGGMDSATVLAQALESDRDCHVAIFSYGSKHGRYENEAAWTIAKYYHRVQASAKNLDSVFQASAKNLAGVFQDFKSNLLKNGGGIPEGHYEAKSMEQTVVPGRNIIFLSIAAGMAWSLGCEEIWIGVHAGDHAIYPDCRPEFLRAMSFAIREGTAGRVTTHAPFIHQTKVDILNVGIPLKVPYHLTRTCYKDQPMACGKCGSCQERLTAYHMIGREDPIPYESRELLPRQQDEFMEGQSGLPV